MTCDPKALLQLGHLPHQQQFISRFAMTWALRAPSSALTLCTPWIRWLRRLKVKRSRDRISSNTVRKLVPQSTGCKRRGPVYLGWDGRTYVATWPAWRPPGLNGLPSCRLTRSWWYRRTGREDRTTSSTLDRQTAHIEQWLVLALHLCR